MRKFLVFLLLTACISFKPVYNLQDEIDDTPRGGTVEIPCGIYEIGTITIDKPLTLEGCGHGFLGQSPGLGSNQWEYLLTNYPMDYVNGTVLRGSIIAGAGVFLRDFSMIGFGSGQGVSMSGAIGKIDAVQIGNYDTCISLVNAYYVNAQDIFLSGCGIGLNVQSSNRITVTHLDIISSGTGIVNNGNGNTFSGVSVQAADFGFDLAGMAGVLSGCYFEQNGVSLDVSGRGHVVNGCYFAANAGDVTVSGINNDVTIFESDVQVTGWYNEVKHSDYYRCVNTVWPTLNDCRKLRE